MGVKQECRLDDREFRGVCLLLSSNGDVVRHWRPLRRRGHVTISTGPSAASSASATRRQRHRHHHRKLRHARPLEPLHQRTLPSPRAFQESVAVRRGGRSGRGQLDPAAGPQVGGLHRVERRPPGRRLRVHPPRPVEPSPQMDDRPGAGRLRGVRAHAHTGHRLGRVGHRHRDHRPSRLERPVPRAMGVARRGRRHSGDGS